MVHDSKGEYTIDVELLGVSLEEYWVKRADGELAAVQVRR